MHPERIKLRLLSRMKPHPTDAYRHSVEKNFFRWVRLLQPTTC